MTSLAWASRRLKSQTTQQFVHQLLRLTIKKPPQYRSFYMVNHRWVNSPNHQESVSMARRLHALVTSYLCVRGSGVSASFLPPASVEPAPGRTHQTPQCWSPSDGAWTPWRHGEWCIRSYKISKAGHWLLIWKQYLYMYVTWDWSQIKTKQNKNYMGSSLPDWPPDFASGLHFVWCGGFTSKHIEADTKWPPLSRRHFEMDFLEW